MSDLALKVVRRVQADLHPSLGFPGGTCQVIERIRNEIRNPGLQEQLINQVEKGKALGKPEANKVYDLQHERGAGLFKRISITPHAQYRMDQRGVGVPQLRATFQTLSKLLLDWKSRKSPRYDEYALKMKRGEPIRWVDPKSKTTIVFAVKNDLATIITVYEEGHPDPRPQAEESCRFEPYFDPKAAALRVAARDVAMRFAAKVKFRTSKSSSQISVELETKDDVVGYILLAPMEGHRLNSECEKNLNALQAKVFGKNPPKIYRVVDVEVAPEWQEQGWGTKLYERALKLAKPALVVTGGCTGMGTTAGAWKIWQALAKQHPSKGRTQNDFVIAVK